MASKLTPELLEKAKQAKSPEELLILAKENGEELTEDSAKAYFDQLHKTGELTDDELDNVAGGGCVQEAVDTVCDTARDALDTARDAMSGGSSGGFGIGTADQVAEIMRKFNEGSGTAIGNNTETGTKTGIGTGFNPGVIKK